MARDYARKSSDSSRRAKGNGNGRPRGLVWFAAGLLPGLLVALLLYLEVNDRPRPPAPVKPQEVTRPAPKPEAPVRPAAPAKPAPSSAKKEPPAPRFEFYTILPEREVVVPDRGEESAATAPPPPPKPAATSSTTTTASAAPAQSEKPAATAAPPQPAVRYYLQAGSFRRFEDADRVKAQLALLGVVAGVQRVTINGGETWHRVRVGPYSDLNRVERVSQQLKSNGIATLLVKEKG